MVSAAMDAVSTQLPSVSAVTVATVMVQIPVSALVQVITPVPLVPEVVSVAVPWGLRLVLDAEAVIVCEARLMVNVTAVEPEV